MTRMLALSVSALLFTTACAASFKDRRTPSGAFCSDMAVVPSGEEPDLEYHRLQPVQSDPKAKTSAERFESLRKAACIVGGDAVIEAEEAEVQNELAQYVKVYSGTAVVWVRPNTGEIKPLTTHKKKKEEGETEAGPEPTAGEPPPPAAPPPATTAAAPPPAPTPTAPPAATPTATATASAAPTTTSKPTKPKLPSNPTPKPPTPKTK